MIIRKRYMYACLSLLLLCLLNANSYGQTLKEFFNNKTIPLTYLGVDFTLAKVQGEVASANEIRDKFEAINTVIATEVKKYDVAGAFQRSTSTNELSMINKLNESASTEKMKTDNLSDLEKNVKPEDVNKHVKAYDLSGKKGIGLVFIIDGMSKTNKEATMYVTLIDLASKKVLMAERMTGKAQGFGLRNYWAYTVYKVLNDIDKHKYSDWADAAAKAPEVKEEVVEEPKKGTSAAKEPKAKKGKKA
ncbi:hypothetical protein SAMN05518672_104667 [Chitinophaga sp. CF118]|uniref:hypothetical protein n=1 Tax=Chitinophaga sp. CF118 TaxID=1884367 RepID=UPI0008E1072A|nr:hypothetical protein [Chitinophaga sp. CF118]SFE15018.1 hypothetical protein SAMN05518672_104667 [Chitinophaga sp. CF118]